MSARRSLGLGRLLGASAPVIVGVLFVGGWEMLVRLAQIPVYILPGPILIAQTLVADWGTLWPSLVVTLKITFAALGVATVGGVALALLFASSRWVERALFPYAVILQVTPLVAIAPLLLIYITDVNVALLVCAWIVAFFPVLSNTTLGLRSADPGLLELFRLYGAGPWSTLFLLRLPSALPYFLGGLRIAGGLALIGAVVAEFTAGTGGTASGLAFRILEAGYRLNIPRMFAALFLISGAGIAIFAGLGLVSRLVLGRWHESAIDRDA